jgi:putative PIN family toxin of toxin-antitoxin system
MPRLKVVLDTNVLVSAHLNSGGFERFVLDLALASKLQLFVSAEILDEYEGVLMRPKFGIAPELVQASLDLIKSKAKRVKSKRRVTESPDPEDNKFLECADAAGADYLITGNKRHFPASFGNTRVVNARELIEIITPDLQR